APSAAATLSPSPPSSAAPAGVRRNPRALPGTRSITPACSNASRWYCAARTPENPIARAISACEGGMPSAAMRSPIRARMVCWVSVSAFISSNTTNKHSVFTSRSDRQVHQPMQCGSNGLAPYGLAVTVEVEHQRGRVATAALPRDPHRADRLVLDPAARPGNAGDRHGQAAAGVDQRAGDHLDRGLPADCAVLFQRRRLHAQHGLLGLVTVRRHAAVEPLRRTGDI